MEKSKLIPFLRQDLDILFIGLNPARGSSDNGHYFSVNQAFWNQLHTAELIKQSIDKLKADDIIFGDSAFNFNNWQYGITDLVTTIAESDSRKIEPTSKDCIKILQDIEHFKPKTAIILHGKVLSSLYKFWGKTPPKTNTGKLGQLISNCKTEFFNIAFPHGNSISSIEKIKRFTELKHELIKLNMK